MNSEQQVSTKSILLQVAISVIAGLILVWLGWLWNAITSWEILVALGLIPSLVLLYQAYQQRSIRKSVLALVSAVIVLVAFYLLFSFRPWCEPEVVELQVWYGTSNDEFISSGLIKVAPNTNVLIKAISQNDVRCTWTYEGDLDEEQEGLCILQLKSGVDQNLDIVSVVVHQRFCAGTIGNLLIDSRAE